MSFQYRMPVRDLYFQRLPNSLQLAFAAFMVSLLIGIPLGIITAVKVDTVWDTSARSSPCSGCRSRASSSAW